MDALNKEKADIEAALSSGTLNGAEITRISSRYSEVKELLDEKEFRWLELNDI